MSKLLAFILLATLCFASCVPNKKVVYLQKGDELKEEVVTDSILRTYNLNNYEYHIQPEDILSVRIESLTQEEYDIFSFQENTIGANNQNLLLTGHLVDKKGNINFPQIGDVAVMGLTIHEIEDKLQTLAATYVQDPVVKVRMLNFRATVLGEVNSEGIVQSFNNRLTIMEAIGLAGGLDDLADRSKIKIIRQENGMSKILYVNLLEEELMNSSNFFVYQNDIIIVPPLKQRPFRRYFGQNVGLILSSVSTLLLVINLINN